MSLIKIIKPLDWVIFAVGAFVVARMDFSAMTLVDVIYMTTLIMWFFMLVFRIYLVKKRERR